MAPYFQMHDQLHSTNLPNDIVLDSATDVYGSSPPNLSNVTINTPDGMKSRWRKYDTYELRLDLIVPVMVCFVVLSLILLIVRYKLTASGRYRTFVAMLGLHSTRLRQDRDSLWRGPEGDPPPDYTTAVNMPSPDHSNCESRRTSVDMPSPSTSIQELNVDNDRRYVAKDVFAVEIRDSDPEESEHYQTEDCNNTKTLAGIGKRSFPDSSPDEQTAEVISCQVTTKIVQSDVFDRNKERLHSLNECTEDQSETNVVGQSNRRKRPNSKIAIFDLHQMAYDPHSPPCYLPTYEEYAQEFYCVHL